MGTGSSNVRGREQGQLALQETVDLDTSKGVEDNGSGRTREDQPSEVDCDGDMDVLVEKIMWQAGTDRLDPEGPLLVIAGSQFPPPSDVSHPRLLDKLRRRLERYAQTAGYTVVLFVNPTLHPPTAAQLFAAYWSLSRAARKNVRSVVIVGGGWWVRVILSIFSSGILSDKSARKIVQCPTLSSLAQQIGFEAFTHIDIPLEVYAANAAVEKEIAVPESAPRTFGVPLDSLMSDQGGHLPDIVRDCIRVLLAQGPQSVGIFRRSPSNAHLAHLQGAYARGHPVSLSTLPDAPYLAASLLKLFLRELPTPLLPRGDVWDAVRACPTQDEDAAIAHLESVLLPLLPPPARTLLQHILAVLSAIAAQADANLMTPSNLVICVCPALIGGLGGVPTRDEIDMCREPPTTDQRSAQGIDTWLAAESPNTVGGVLRIMIERYDRLFPGPLLTGMVRDSP